MPQIIITDMKMPGMSGITLIKKIKQISSDVRFLVLSNYDDFKLVSEAFKEGVSDYILKESIEPDNLIAVLSDISKSFNVDSLDITSAALKQKSNKKKREEVLLFMIERHHKNEEVYESMAKDVEISFNASNYKCFLIHLKKKIESEHNEMIEELIPDNILDNIMIVISEICSKYGKNNVVKIGEQSLAIIITLSKSTKTKDMVKDINDSIKLYFGVYAQIACSKDNSNFENINIAYNQSRKALDMRFYFNDECFFDFNEIEYLTDIPEEIKGKKRDMTKSLKVYDFEGAEELFDEMYLEFIKAEHIFPNIVKMFFINIVQEVKNYVENEYEIEKHDELNIFCQETIDSIWKNEYIHNIQNYMKVFFDRIKGIVKTQLVSSSTIQNVRNYVLTHYYEKISLQEIATQFYINPNYLSQQFKEKTGEYFSNFVRRIRIEKAIELMKKKNCSIDEIAERVGYDSNYFVKAFKKETNATVTEFRKRCL